MHTYAAPEHRAELWLEWEQGLRKLLESAEPGSDHQLTFARAYAAAAHSDQAVADLEALLDGSLAYDGLEVDADLRWLLLQGLARTGHADEERIAAELANDNTISGQEHAAACRAARPTAEAKAAAWEQAMVDPDVPNETHRNVVMAFNKPGQARGAAALRREVPRQRRQHLGPARQRTRVRSPSRACSRGCWPPPSCSPRSTRGWRRRRPTRARCAR